MIRKSHALRRLLLAAAVLSSARSSAVGQTLYTFGDPTADEQHYIELINRARANPAAEGARLASNTDPDVLNAYTQYGVSLALLQSEFNLIAAAPPLAPNGPLTVAARGHSAWMLATGIQAHDQPTNNLASRATAAGYNWSGLSENIYAFVKRPWHGHAGFQVDWGPNPDGTPSPGGMQPGRGHRMNNHNPNRREIGVGVTYGTKTGPSGTVGPQQVTQDFGTPANGAIFGTGVAYYDLNGNDFYDPGEQISDLTVNIDGASYYCKTAPGGGWAMPIPPAASTRTVTFTDLHMDQSVSLSNPENTNAKADLKLAYNPPAISSPAVGYANSPYHLAFPHIGGATSYQWRRWTTATAPAENAETTTGITSSTLGGYNLLSTTVKQQGASSFRLVVGGGPGTQWIELSTIYLGNASSMMSFQSRLRYTGTSELYKVQIREEGTANWVDIDSQPGSGGAGQASFSLRNASLAALAGKPFRVRFLLQYGNGTYYPGTADTHGWFIDAIQFTNVQALRNEVSASLTDPAGTFTPAVAGNYFQAVYPVISGNVFPAGYQALAVSAGPPPGFAGWAVNLESAHSLPAGTLSDPTGDPDKDGRVNLLEYAFGTSPVVAVESTPRWPVTSATTAGLTLDYQVDASLTDLTIMPVATVDMASWKTPGEARAPSGFTDQLIGTNGNIQSRRATLPLASGTKGFVTLRVTRNP